MQHSLPACQQSPLPLPLGEVAERSEVGEGTGFSKKIQKYRIFAKQIFDNPLSHADA